eukprot:scaffold58039_cov21-Tisochrysis_lutea.AAC.2
MVKVQNIPEMCQAALRRNNSLESAGMWTKWAASATGFRQQFCRCVAAAAAATAAAVLCTSLPTLRSCAFIEVLLCRGIQLQAFSTSRRKGYIAAPAPA